MDIPRSSSSSKLQLKTFCLRQNQLFTHLYTACYFVSPSQHLSSSSSFFVDMSSVSTSIVLDTTLRDIYALQGSGDNIIHAFAIPTAEVQLSAGIHLSEKFTNQSPLHSSKDREIIACMLLQLIPQFCAFMVGKMPVFVFDLDQNVEDSRLLNSKTRRLHQADAYRVLDQLAPQQRPDLTFVERPSDIKLGPNDQLAIFAPMDCLLPLPHLVDPEAHYELLSKRGLALSGLPTPETEVVDTVLGSAQVSDRALVDSEVRRMMSRIRNRQPPFVIKMPQSFSGHGTFMIRTNADRSDAIRILEPETKRMLGQINPRNSHMNPCSLMLQRMIPEGERVALSLFVSKSGRAIFNACCHQLVHHNVQWGDFIDYREQDALQARYADMTNKLSAYAHQKGYLGPIGADILTDVDGQQMIVDINARMTSCHPLGALRGHFGRLGLNVAAILFSSVLRLTRDELGSQFGAELRLGSMVVIAWVHMRDEKTSMAIVALAAEEKEKLDELIERVKVFKLE